jgi:hypothetical protein
MFAPLSEPVALSQEGLEGLCVSLNRPFVELESLPPGPARAAIALHRSASGERRLLLAVRSVDSGAVAFFAFAGRLSASPHKALDAGLSLAERLGFLFDDDMLQATTISGPAAGAQRALECWYELLGEEPPRTSELAAGSDPDDILDVELVEPLDVFELDTGGSEDGSGDSVDLFDPELEENVPLSKFRPGQEQPDPMGESSTTLGRVALVRRSDSEEGSAIGLATRLLASF